MRSRKKLFVLALSLLWLITGLAEAGDQTEDRSRAFPGIQVGQTYFDAQHLTSMGRQIAHVQGFGSFDDTVAVSYVWRGSPGVYGFVRVAYLIDCSGSWAPFGLTADVQMDPSYAPDLSLYGRRAIVGFAEDRGGVDPLDARVARDWDDYLGFFGADNIALPVSTCGGEYSGSYDGSYGFPKIAVDVNQYGDTSVHVVTTESGIPPADGEMRSLVYFQGVPNSDPLDFGTCGTFIDSVMARGAVIAASEYNDEIAIAYLAPREKDFSVADPRNNDLMFIKSTDDGLTWWPPQNITNYLDTDPERAYPDITITEFNGDFHVVWTAIEYDYATDTYSEQKCRLKHWSDFYNEITTFAWAENEQSCTPGHRMYNIAKPTLTEIDNELYVVYTRFPGDTHDGTEDCSAGGNANGELYAQASISDGDYWGLPVNLTNTTSDGCAPGDCLSENWPSTPHDSYDSLRILYIGDTDAGAYTVCEGTGCPAEGSETECDVMFLDIGPVPFEHWVDWRISNDDFSSPPMTCEIDDVVDTSFTMINRGSLEVHFNTYVSSGSATPYLTFYGPAGLIGHERDTAEFMIHFVCPSTPGTYTAELTIEIYETSETITIPVAYEVTGETEYECGDVNLDGVVDVNDEADIYQYLFNGVDIDSLELGDVDECGGVNVADLNYWMEWEYFGGPAPCEGSVTYCDEYREGCFIELGCPEYEWKGERGWVNLPIYLTNDVPLIGLTLGFKHNSQDATDFAVTDAAGILSIFSPPQPSCDVCGYPDDRKALFYFRGDGTTVLEPQSGGLAGYVTLELPSSPMDQIINIDTATVPHLLEPMFVPVGGGVIRPHYYDCGAGEIFVGDCVDGTGPDCYYITETGEGADVDVDLGEVDLSFSEITGAGVTWMSITTDGETPPSGYVMQPMGEPLYYNILTDAGYAGSIEICIDYSDRDIHPYEEPGLLLLHFDGAIWTDITTSLDTENDIICGVTTSLSPFILATLPLPSTLTTLAAMKDNTIYQENDNSNGSGSYLFTGNTAGEVARRALVAFDIAGGIPAGARIDSVFLDLYMSRTDANDFDISLYHVLEDWGEGASDAPGQEGIGAPAEIGDATWQHTFYDTDFWQTAGGYYYSQPAATVEVDQVGFYTWGTTPEMVFDVQNWLDIPADNFGWIMINDELEITAKRFDSRENEVPANRPQLRVYYYTEAPQFVCGDANADELTNITDAVYLIQYIFNGGEAPQPYLAGDTNCDTIVNITDAVYLIQYIFGGGAPPCDTDDDGTPDC